MHRSYQVVHANLCASPMRANQTVFHEGFLLTSNSDVTVWKGHGFYNFSIIHSLAFEEDYLLFLTFKNSFSLKTKYFTCIISTAIVFFFEKAHFKNSTFVTCCT